MLVSGGVDSTVAFALLNRSLENSKVFGLFIDNGFMRKNEIKNVLDSLKSLGKSNLFFIDASEKFISAVNNIYEPEEKRKIIGKVFLDVVHDQEQLIMNDEKLNKDTEWLLGQGTIYPDVIESKGTKNSDKIKTHHNRIEFIQKMKEDNKVIEPLQNFYKDEVRQIGLGLGIPGSMISRHPFPGPGLSLRCLCSKNSLEINIIYKEIEDIDEENFVFFDNILYTAFYQGVILPVKCVGVQGDERTYRNPLALFSAKKSIENSLSDLENLEKLSTKLTNKISQINRVIYLISHKELPLKMNLFKKYITKERIGLIREIDALVYELLEKNNLIKVIWQCPVILIPFGIIYQGNELESVVIRPVCSKEGMTANFTKIDSKILVEIAENIIKKFPEIAFVFYDVTNKPPGTIEWE